MFLKLQSLRIRNICLPIYSEFQGRGVNFKIIKMRAKIKGYEQKSGLIETLSELPGKKAWSAEVRL